MKEIGHQMNIGMDDKQKRKTVMAALGICLRISDI